MAKVDVDALVLSMATRSKSRSEADVQADIRTLLLWGGLNLEEAQVVSLEVSTSDGTRRRIDIEAGFAVIEVKNDLRVGNVRADAITQLAGYVQTQTQKLGQRYVGVLTDGAEWYLYHLDADGALSEVSAFTVSPADPDVNGLKVWLEGILATGTEIEPTPTEIERRLGAVSPSFLLDHSTLTGLYAAAKNDPEVAMKRALWAKLLRTAFGTNFTDEDAMFVDHTYLVVSAEIIAHAVVGFDPADPNVTPEMLVTGALFSTAQIRGVVEADFFDWVLLAPGGREFVTSLARRLARFKWEQVKHDVLKVLYESVITADQRHKLGEYYTPDWLADRVVTSTVTDPLNQRVLDPSCGSGTFVFHAVQHYLGKADEAGMPNGEALHSLVRHVSGVDVHPVAVTLARVTYLLAIGTKRLQADDRGPLTIPVFLGDSLQWDQNTGMLSDGGMRVPTETDGPAMLLATDLMFPEEVIADAGRFDQLVTAMVDRATSRTPGDPVPKLSSLFRTFAASPDGQATLQETFRAMCELHDLGQNHIWGYYVRNLIRPLWLALPENKVDVLVGNPPWLSYRFMTAKMQADFRDQSQTRGLWAGKTVATNQDLSAYFVVRCIEVYLKAGGAFSFVMPHAVLSRKAYAGFREAKWSSPLTGTVNVTFKDAWDLSQVKPSIFPVPSAVVRGDHTPGDIKALGTDVEHWSGKLPGVTVEWDVAKEHLAVEGRAISVAAATHASPYASRFTEGATVVPRVLVTVEKAPTGPLGAGVGRTAVRSRRSSLEKPPWKDLQGLTGNVDTAFVRRMHLGSTLAPYRMLEPWLAVVPWDGKKLLAAGSTALDAHQGLATWWNQAEALWQANRTEKAPKTLNDRLDYHGGLRVQFPASAHRIVYTKSGMTLAAARVADDEAVIDHTLYWAATSGADEGRYLCAIINSQTVLDRVLPLMNLGGYGPRHIDKYLFQVDIPLYDPDNDAHRALALLGERAETIAAAVTLTDGTAFQAARKTVRDALIDDGVAAEIETAVDELLPPPVV